MYHLSVYLFRRIWRVCNARLPRALLNRRLIKVFKMSSLKIEFSLWVQSVCLKVYAVICRQVYVLFCFELFTCTMHRPKTYILSILKIRVIDLEIIPSDMLHLSDHLRLKMGNLNPWWNTFEWSRSRIALSKSKNEALAAEPSRAESTVWSDPAD